MGIISNRAAPVAWAALRPTRVSLSPLDQSWGFAHDAHKGPAGLESCRASVGGNALVQSIRASGPLCLNGRLFACLLQ